VLELGFLPSSGINLLRQCRDYDPRELSADILKAMRLLPGQAPALPATLNVPLDFVKPRLSNDLNPFIKRYQNSADAMGMKRLNDWFVQLASNVVAALLLFLSFAVVGKRFPTDPTLLQSVLSGRLLCSFGGRRHQPPSELDEAMRRMMPEENEHLR